MYPCWGELRRVAKLMGSSKFVRLACEGHRAYLVNRAYIEQPAVLALAELVP